MEKRTISKERRPTSQYYSTRAMFIKKLYIAYTSNEAVWLFVTEPIIQEIVNCTSLEGKRTG